MQALDELHQRMAAVSGFSFTARGGPQSQTAWNGTAIGQVSVARDGKSLVFNEVGNFTPECSTRSFNQTNFYRWEFLDDSVNVYQERRGEPVFLVNLIVQDDIWQTHESHLCVKDLYSLKLEIIENEIIATWTISGPKKDESLEYRYRSNPSA